MINLFKKVLFCILFYPVFLNAQVTQGIIDFDIMETDTINNTVTNLPDSIKFTYYFKDKLMKVYNGTDSVNNSLICNNNGSYFLDVAFGNKAYSFNAFSIPNSNLDTLLNFNDTTKIYVITTEHKAVMGYYCTKAYLIQLSDIGDTLQTMIIWYTEQIKGNNFIKGASTTALNLNGLILEYEIPTQNGTRLVTPKSINLNAVEDSVFNPNLTGYINTDATPD